jgi:hypothetical protein
MLAAVATATVTVALSTVAAAATAAGYLLDATALTPCRDRTPPPPQANLLDAPG